MGYSRFGVIFFAKGFNGFVDCALPDEARLSAQQAFPVKGEQRLAAFVQGGIIPHHNYVGIFRQGFLQGEEHIFIFFKQYVIRVQPHKILH